MKKSLKVWQFAGFIFTVIAGVLLHFIFDWTNKNVIIAAFSAVNESIFEHTKLLFFPMFIFALVQNRYIGREYGDFWCIKLIGIVSGVILIPVLYYTINGVFGNMPGWVNIAMFFVTAAFSYTIETLLFNYWSVKCNCPQIAFFVLCLLTVTFMVFTFFAPNIPFFQDTITGTYGYINQ